MCPRRLTKLRMCEAKPPPGEAAADVSSPLAFSPDGSGGFLLRLSKSASFISTASYCNNDFYLVLDSQVCLCVRAARHDVSVALDRNTLAGIAQRVDQLSDRARLGHRMRRAIKKDFHSANCSRPGAVLPERYRANCVRLLRPKRVSRRRHRQDPPFRSAAAGVARFPGGPHAWQRRYWQT